MDPCSSNGFQLQNQSTAGPIYEITDPNKDLSEEHSSQELKSVDGILRYIDQILMDEDMEPHNFQKTSDFRARERSFYEALGQQYVPSPQQESITESSDCEKDIVSCDNNVPIEEFDDDVWIYTLDGRDKDLASYISDLQITGRQIMGSSTTPKIHKKKHKAEKDEALVDLRLLLINCATSVAGGDRLTSNELLKQIRQHSSPFGDGTQRLAHYFAHGLEARLAGTGSLIHKFAHPSDYLKTYLMACASSSLMKISSFVTNKMIVIESEKAARAVVHIIDFGILYGFQWPAFIKCVAEREGGPPKKLRITGVDFPRAAGIIEEAGHRLARYAEKYGVPFEYKAIVREWETIKIEDLKIEEGEFVAVVCSLRAMNLMDETVVVGQNPRSMFLKLIREIKPDIFVHGIVNGAYSEPFFMYRFRELLLHFLALFDMVETFVPRDKPERMLIEKNILGKRALNVIACEGRDRVERPETYKKWQVRHVKAGFMKVPFERKLVDSVMDKVNNSYHRDFVIGEDNKWLLISWKGRILYAISCWHPV